ncbi:MAG TPA: hypothetical protein VM146_17510 [Steroidobacteraceae bacterium]|nr:hypothetical protein [Steroidobacteraceae bacterium]
MRIALTIPSLALVLLAGLATVCVSGCNGMRKLGNGALPGQPFGKTEKIVCKQSNKDYIGAKEMPPLKAPDGLENPDTRNGLKIPQLDTPERVRGRDESCLDAPPPFGPSKSAPPAPAALPAKPREVPTQ